MRRTKEEAEQTKENLISAALKLFGEKGVLATRLEDIARAAGVSRGALNWHFDGKDDIIIELLKRRTEPFFNLLENTLRKTGPALERIRDAFIALLSHVENDSGFRDSMMLEFERSIQADREDRFYSYIRESKEKYGKLLQAVIDEGKQHGSIRNDYETPELMQYFGRAITGSFIDIRMQRGGDNCFGTIDPVKHAELVISALKP